MTKSTTALSGASKTAYFRRLLADEQGTGPADRQHLLARIDAEVRYVRVRSDSLDRHGQGTRLSAHVSSAPLSSSASPDTTDFDPFTPNAIVVLRTRGAAALLEELGKVETADQLRQLAKAQQLSVAADVKEAGDLRAAIVAAADRRVANRRAAGS